MTLTLHFHPLASFCHKVLIALYENDTPFDPVIVDFGDQEAKAAFFALWPMGKMPVLVDSGRDRIVPESTIIIDYLDQHHPGPQQLIPADPDLARQVRLADRFFDSYVHVPMQRIVADRLRPEGKGDAVGVLEARAQIATAYAMIERDMAEMVWAAGDDFSLADCAAAPALFYANKVAPFGSDYPNIDAYFSRLLERPSYARVLAEAEPYFKFFPV